MIADSDQRRMATEESDRSFAVEASAGTGKTTILIDRILHMVLDRGPDGTPLPLSRICAITFTEKAAGEMKIRLRQKFEKEASLAGERGTRAREALRDLEAASISTFHAFAVALLKERPIEAELDPRFTALDEIQSDLLFREVWDTWLQHALLERQAPLECALRAGLGLQALREAARTIRLHAHAVRKLKLVPPPTEEETRQQMRQMLEEGRRFLGRVGKPDDKLAGNLGTALRWLENPTSETSFSKPRPAGAAANWRGAKETVALVQEFVKGVAEFCARYGSLPAERALDAAIRWIIDDFLAKWEARKRVDGVVDFDDMLWCARDLLQRSPAAREAFQRQYAALLVDEFQDTDSVQWEIVRLLTSGVPEEARNDAGVIGPGRLFIVGDPKQSIYRFRGADIETYLNVAAPENMMQLGLRRLELTTNFRSVPSILKFVDAAFSGIMTRSKGGRYQPDYLPFGGAGARVEEAAPPSVYILGDRDEEAELAGSGSDFVSIEARRIARLIVSMRGNSDWIIQDRGKAAPTEKSGWRAPQWGDIAVLLPVLTRADALETALYDAGISYVLEGGKFYYARSEVFSAINVLRAVANPNDSVALYGALRSIFFGLSDEDLLRARVQGEPLDYRGEVRPGSALLRPYTILRELHLRRHERTASETFETLLQRTGAREVLALRGNQSLANLGKLARTLRSLQQEATFSQVVDLLSVMDEEGTSESESRIMEERSDAVRILSIHRAKGLDFPIVIIAGLGLHKQTRYPDFLADPHGTGTFAMRLGSGGSQLQTPGYGRLAEADRARAEAELVRLLYVALTRVRDHLVLCTHTKGKKQADGERWNASFEGTRLKPLAEFLCQLGETGDPVRFVDAAALDRVELQRPPDRDTEPADIRGTLHAQYEELRKLLSETPKARGLHAAAAGGESERGEEGYTYSARDRAMRIGTAFHEAMEVVDLDGDPDVEGLAREAGARQSLDGAGVKALEEMLSRSLNSPLMERVRRSRLAGGRVWRELPYVRPLDQAEIEEGKIDLLFEEPGGWVLVEYKTDRIPDETEDTRSFFADKYAGQVRAYVSSLQMMGVKVHSAYLLLARTADHIEIPL